MPTARPESAGRRGPIARHPPRTPTGFRIDDRTRFELEIAGAFTGNPSLQTIIDLAVRQYLERLKERAGFRDALSNAEDYQQREAGVAPSDSPTAGRRHNV